MNLPNRLSLLRIFLAAAFTVFLSLERGHFTLAALLCFLIATFTDWLDGYLARRLNLITAMGKLLDPLADKLLIAAAFVCFTERGICPAWVTILILFREFSVTGLRLLLVEKGEVLPADGWGKWKTVSQMAYCILTLLSLVNPELGNVLIGNILLGSAVFLTCISGVNYFIKGRKALEAAH